MLTLGVRGEEVLEPARDFFIRPARKHACDLTL
jgi:hypothetical protein